LFGWQLALRIHGSELSRHGNCFNLGGVFPSGRVHSAEISARSKSATLGEGKIELATLMNLQTNPQIVAFYPCRSLIGQLKSWSEQRGGLQLQLSWERSLDGIRCEMQRADFVVVDATEDPAQASDAYFQIFKTLGSESMTVYTEIVHEGLEMLVRRLGVSLLLGPMDVGEWDDFFVHKFPRTIRLPAAQEVSRTSAAEETASEEQPVTPPYSVKSIAG
jgi:hypothetical protein